MELRSSRSRSKTPFVVETFDKESIEKESSSKKVVKMTRKTTTRSQINSSEVSSTTSKPRKSSRLEKSSKKITYKTSDYSSEDNELDNSFISKRSITQNEKNQFIEDARALANGSGDISALDLYRSSERYWDKYPKTDYTYSYHSQDRFEIAPGEVIMPNMSRRTIHNIDCTLTDMQSKSTNTEMLEAFTNLYKTDNIRGRKLFNNNFDDTVDETTSRYSALQTLWYTTKRRFMTIISTVITIFYFFQSIQTSVFAKIHRFCSWVMLLDTYLMRKNPNWNKQNKLAILCLVPLLFFGAWYLLTFLGSIFGAIPFNSTTESVEIMQNNEEIFKNIEETLIKSDGNIKTNEKNTLVTHSEFSNEDVEKIALVIKEKIDLTEKINTDKIVHEILHNANFINVINKQKNLNQDEVVGNLREDISKIKLDLENRANERRIEIDNIINNIRNENAENSARLSVELKKCCQNSLVDIEAYVGKLVGDFLNDPEYMGNQKGFAQWLKGILVAKEELEVKLENVATRLEGQFEGLLKENTKVILDDISAKIHGKIPLDSVGSISDEYIRTIVRKTLNTYDADKTGLVDYAMEPMGGQVLTTRCTEAYHSGKAVVSVLGIPLWYPVNTPRTIITPGINPGECFAFENFPGFLVIKLSSKIKIEAFSLEHVNKLLVPNGKIDSAPKNFEVYGLISENDKNPVKIGDYTYDYNGDPLQFFYVNSQGHIFDHVELRIISNHGNPNYTCLYRFRVHGKLSNEHR